jgi:hypothetical protein
MMTVVPVVFWVAVLAVVAFFVVREVRAKKAGPKDFDRFQHQAVRESDQHRSTNGPTNTSQIGFGG